MRGELKQPECRVGRKDVWRGEGRKRGREEGGKEGGEAM